MIIRKFQEKDLEQMIEIWNEVVEDGIAFPQSEKNRLKGANYGEKDFNG